MAPIGAISRENTAPGTKVLVKGAKIVSGYLLVQPQKITVLGGKVEHLYDKWILAKSIQENLQQVSNEGAPPWVAFGGKIISGRPDGSFKSLVKGKDDNSDSEFEQLRKDAIAEAATGVVKKSFGGRVRQNVQPVQNTHQYNKGRPHDRDRGDQDRGRRGRFASRDNDDGAETFQKPSEKISLFSFLADKLPVTDSKKAHLPSPSYNRNSSQDYHQKDTRGQIRNDEGRSQNRQQYDKTPSNNHIYRDRATNYNSNSASKQSAPRAKSSLVSNNLPQKSYENPKQSTNENRNGAPTTINNGNTSRGNQGRPANGAKDNFGKPQYQGPPNQNRNNNNKYGQSQAQGPSNQRRNDNRDRYSHRSSEHFTRDNANQQYPQSRFSNKKYPHQESAQSYPKINSVEERTEIDNGSHQMSHSNNHYSENPQQYNQRPPGSNDVNMHQLANNLSKMAVSIEFASRSLRQHLNLDPLKQGSKQELATNGLTVGEQCLAKYWEDGKFYPAVIAAVTENTFAVQFKGYGNIEEVLKQDCFAPNNSRSPNSNYPNSFASSSMEFRSRRGPPRN
uniref:Survival of motor neuron-related-splicing factor 30 n=2 Tax=Dendroctonus ponderosae TaxID=77166 RepID=A0AAR5Q1Z7_DENPD